MGERLLAHALAAEPEPLNQLEVISAGISAFAGDPASANSVRALKKVGIDLSQHRSRRLDPYLLDEAALILCMTEGHRQMALQLITDDHRDLPIHLFREFMPGDVDHEVPDPYGASLDYYLETRDALAEAVPSVVAWLRERYIPAKASKQDMPTATDPSLNLNAAHLRDLDPEIFEAIENEKNRQQNHLELIASENFTYPAVIEATGSVLTNKYAEGYPRKRYYGGCECVDVAEELAIERAKQLFGAEYANVQPHAGSQANFGVYTAVLNVGDKILTMNLSDGGHLTHGNPVNFSGKLYEVVHYGVDPETGRIDYDKLAEQAEKEKPKMITVGASAYPREIDFKRMGEIARSVGAYILADIAHIAGLVATGEHPSPVPHCDFVTTTTHKTLRGPRGGLILAKGEYEKKLNSAIFPGGQGGPLMHVIAAKAVCFREAAKPEFKQYQQQVKRNIAALADFLKQKGYKLCSDGTDNHLILVDLRQSHPDLSGKQAQIALDKANITTNRNTVPGETRSPFQTSGIRIGSPACTSRGMKEDDFREIGRAIDIVLNHPEDDNAISQARDISLGLCAKYPLPY
ncbi:MAG: glycine hydroxymethyltransferase [Puniceicoccaceae bacterium 5H]|nr:MAG: glycine hydroxymethyltransferase [Puniceicoccaceae bacterium 5H]